MSALKGNKVLPVVAGVVLIGLGWVIFSGEDTEVQEEDTENRTDSTNISLTPKEEIRMLAEQVQSLRDEKNDLANKVKQEILSELPKGESEQPDVEVIQEMIDHRLNSILSEEQIDPYDAPSVDEEVSNDFGIGEGRRTEKTNSNTKAFKEQFQISNEGSSGGYASGDMQWQYPVGYNPESGGMVDSVKNTVTQWGDKGSSSANSPDGIESEEVKPFITIPSDSRIYDVRAVTAMVGRIEKNGNNKAPWGFSATLSNYSSLANGFNLPEIDEARVSGVVIGDLAGKCVKGMITSITFIFPDGRIANAKGSFEKPLAKVADEYGNPCIPGVYFDNLQEVIAAQGTISGLASIAKSIEKRQQSIDSTATSQSLVLNGSESLAALGSGLSGGLDKTGQIVADKYDAFYSFVYVEPGETITLLVDENIAIDYDPNGRKVRYEDETEFAFN